MLHKPYKTLKSGLKLYGNNHNIPIIYGWELTDKEKKEFDYYTDEELNCGAFFRYKGNVYDLHDIMRYTGKDDLTPYADGIVNDTFFSGIVVKYTSDESVKVFTFIC